MRFSNAFISIMLLTSLAAAQQTSPVKSRDDQLEREALEKARRLGPPQPDELKRGIEGVENSLILPWK
jgi:hypothetical protein